MVPLCRGSPQELVSVARNVAAVPTSSVWVAGPSARMALGHRVPISDHCADSLVPLGQAAKSIPPVLSTCLVSNSALVTPPIVTSTSGITPSGVQVVAAPSTPMSEVSKDPLVPPHTAAATGLVWVTISCCPGCNTVPCCQMSKVQVLTFTMTELTVCGIVVLLTTRTAPAS